MIGLKLILKEFLGLLNLIKAQALYIYYPIKIIIVAKNENFIFVAIYIVATGLKSFNNT